MTRSSFLEGFREVPYLGLGLRLSFWIFCLAIAHSRYTEASTTFSRQAQDGYTEEQLELCRPDGDMGHTHIDFGGQWLMGRMFATGNAAHLYNRNYQWPVVWDGFRVADESPLIRMNSFPESLRDQERLAQSGLDPRHDADKLMFWFMGDTNDSFVWSRHHAKRYNYPHRDDPHYTGPFVDELVALPLLTDPLLASPLMTALLLDQSATRFETPIELSYSLPTIRAECAKPAIGGPLYPPIHGLLYAPLGYIDSPARAYKVFQVFLIFLTFVAGLATSVVSEGRIPWSVATSVLFLFSGYHHGLNLGQNPAVTIAILMVGWALAARQCDGLGGIVWGFLAFKPVWAVVFLLVPILMGRRKFAVAMCATGLALILITLPFVGIHSWKDWLAVGVEATTVYETNQGWIGLSRDLTGFPNRIFVDAPVIEERFVGANRVGLLLTGSVLLSTLAIYYWRGSRKLTGTGAGFLFLGAYLGCYRFMYYDVLLAYAAFVAFLADTSRLLRDERFFISFVPSERSARSSPCGRWVGAFNSLPLMVLFLLMILESEWMDLGIEADIKFPRWKYHVSPENPKVPDVQILFRYSHQMAWDTLFLLGLWAVTAIRLIVLGDDEPVQTPAGTQAGSH